MAELESRREARVDSGLKHLEDQNQETLNKVGHLERELLNRNKRELTETNQDLLRSNQELLRQLLNRGSRGAPQSPPRDMMRRGTERRDRSPRRERSQRMYRVADRVGDRGLQSGSYRRYKAKAKQSQMQERWRTSRRYRQLLFHQPVGSDEMRNAKIEIDI